MSTTIVSKDEFETFDSREAMSLFGNRFLLEKPLPLAPHVPIGHEFIVSHGVITDEGIYLDIFAVGRRSIDSSTGEIDVLHQQWISKNDLNDLFRLVE